MLVFFLITMMPGLPGFRPAGCCFLVGAKFPHASGPGLCGACAGSVALIANAVAAAPAKQSGC